MTNKLHTRTLKTITYDKGFDDTFDGWAAECGWEPKSLRRASEKAIRTRHHEATHRHEANKARGRQPDIWHLSLGTVWVIYTVEPHAVVVRGYAWDLDRKPLDAFDGGGHYCDFEWSLPLAE
jgi:hypothetical protein